MQKNITNHISNSIWSAQHPNAGQDIQESIQFQGAFKSWYCPLEAFFYLVIDYIKEISAVLLFIVCDFLSGLHMNVIEHCI